MNKILKIYKPVGKTPLEMINLIKEKFPEYKYVKMGYAGRLDPMAEGVLIILAGEECKNRKEYEGLPKEYEVEVLLGIETDSYDLMGIIQNIRPPQKIDGSLQKKCLEAAQSFVGEFEQPYPPYSSVGFKGKSLFHWAKENKLSEIQIPSKKVTIYSVDYLQKRVVTGKELLNYVTATVTKVNGHFRQEKIIANWQEKMEESSFMSFVIYKYKIACSSGTYMRSVAHEIGKKIGVPALASTIKRTKVGSILYTSLTPF